MNWTLVEKFLRAVRLRLWLQATLERLRLGIWVGSSVLLAAAVVNLVGIEITSAIAMFAALSVALAVTLTTLVHRPGLERCALHADRAFHTESLIITALELSTAPRRPLAPAAAVVRTRACAAARQLKPQLSSVWRAPRPAGFVLALVPVFVATVLFALSDGGPAASGGAGDPLMSSSVVGQSRLDSDTSLRELRQSIASSAMPRSDRRDEQGSDPRASLTPRDQAAAESSEAAAITEARNDMPGLSTGNAQGGREAGRARRSTDLSGNRELTGSAPGPRETVWLRRHGAVTADAGNGGQDFEKGITLSAAGVTVALAAAAPPTLSAWTALTPAEAAYARRYLGSKETDND